MLTTGILRSLAVVLLSARELGKCLQMSYTHFHEQPQPPLACPQCAPAVGPALVPAFAPIARFLPPSQPQPPPAPRPHPAAALPQPDPHLCPFHAQTYVTHRFSKMQQHAPCTSSIESKPSLAVQHQPAAMMPWCHHHNGHGLYVMAS